MKFTLEKGFERATNKLGKYIMVTAVILFAVLILANAYKLLKSWDVHPLAIIAIGIVALLCSLLAYAIATAKPLESEKHYWERKERNE